MRSKPAALAYLIFLVLMGLMTPAFAQTATTAAAGPSAPVIQSDPNGQPQPQKNATRSDEAIASRLMKILQLTGWFTNPKVISQEGIVTLEGEAQAPGQRDWAIALAQKADGVVAVVNKISVKEVGWFDLSPARNELKSFLHNSVSFLPHMLAAALILLIVIPLYSLVVRLSSRFWATRISNPILAEVMPKIGAAPILLIGLYLVLQALNLTGLAFTILGGTGAVGLVAGFAFKNILENYFSGVMLSTRKPFVIGDVIEVAGEKGVVLRLTTRGTTLVDFDGNHILIPNSTIFTSIIKNRSASPLTRVHTTVEIEEGENVDLRKRQVHDFLHSRSEIARAPEAQVQVSADNPRALDVFFWINVRETSADKLKSILNDRMQATGGSVIVGQSEPSTKSETLELLQRAEVSPLRSV